MSARSALVLVANTRLPSQRAQALQVVQMAGAFERAGARTTLLYAKRRERIQLRPGQDLFEWYGLADGLRPALEEAACIDWIDRVPRALQYVPARLQEETFARAAARAIVRGHPGARVLAREAECALRLVRHGRSDVWLEIHRVPGGRWRRRVLQEATRGAAGTIAISNGVREDLVKLGVRAESILVEHDGFEPARFRDLPARDAARAALGLPPEAAIVVYTGGLLAWKGVDVLVDAARELPEAYVVIAGGMDADVQALRQRAGGLANVRIDGFQSPERIALYLAAGDVGVVPNRSQPAISARYTSPLKVFEAMAAGLPLVASDLSSLREILTDGVDAKLVAADDPKALAQGIDALLGDAQLRAKLAANLRARASEHTWEARARRILAWMTRG